MKTIVAAALVAAGTAQATEIDLGNNRETTQIIVPLQPWTNGPNSITLDFGKPIYARGEFQIGMLSVINAGITFLGDTRSWLVATDGTLVALPQPQMLVSPGILWLRDLLEEPTVFEGVRFDFTMPKYFVVETELLIQSTEPFGIGSVPETADTLELLASAVLILVVVNRKGRSGKNNDVVGV